MSPHHRTNLLKLIDLAIGSPTPGSVSFNLLHKVLYILAVRSGSVEHDEIELGHVGDSTPLLPGRVLPDAEDGRTRLMVQRVSGGGGGDDQTLKITGSRIVVPWELQPLDGGRRTKQQRSSTDFEDDTEEELKSQLSTISSVVSELGERVQEMAQRPDEGVEKLKQRVDALERLVELQTKEISSLREGGKSIVAEHECDFTKEKSELWKAIDAMQNKIQNFSAVIKEETAEYVERVVVEEVQQNESLELNIADANQRPVPNSMNWSMDLSMQQFEELVAKQNRFEQSLESLAMGTDACYKDTIVQLQSLNDQLQTIEDSTAAKLEQLERSIERLSQQKANEVEIDSRVRMSIHQARPSILAPPRTVDLVALPQTNPHIEEQMMILTEQIKSTQNDLYDLRENLNGKASTDYMITLESALTDQIKQLQRDIKALSSQKATSSGDRGAAGSKMKLLQDVGCISCDREVVMRTCEEVIPQPAILRINRTVKANLRYQLSEIRKGLELHPGSAASNLVPVDRVYRSIAQGKKANRSK